MKVQDQKSYIKWNTFNKDMQVLLNRGYSVAVGLTSPYIWIPATMFGIDLNNVYSWLGDERMFPVIHQHLLIREYNIIILFLEYIIQEQ